jgi:MarR family transcriptional regulator, organic hydroperoxide resistance regulator
MRKSNLDEFTPAQGRIVFLLLQKDNIPMHDLVDKADLSKSTLSTHLDNLERKGFVEKISSNEDRREIFIKLTGKANKLKKDYLKISQKMIELFYDGFDGEDIDNFEYYLHKCLQNLESHQ